MMNKTFSGLLLVCGAVIFNSCGDKQKDMSESEIHAKVDSIVGSRVEEINRLAMEDLDHRMAIDVKAKADSIVQSHMAMQATPPPPPPPFADTGKNAQHMHRAVPIPKPASVPVQHPVTVPGQRPAAEK